MHTHSSARQHCRIIGSWKKRRKRTRTRYHSRCIRGDEGRPVRILLGLAPTTHTEKRKITFRALVLGGVRCLHTWGIIIDLPSSSSVCSYVLPLSSDVMIFLRVCMFSLPARVILLITDDDASKISASHIKKIYSNVSILFAVDRPTWRHRWWPD